MQMRNMKKTINNVMSSVSTACSVCLIVLMMSCSKEQPKITYVRPEGNLGDSINSVGEDFAPFIPPTSESLYFTSRRDGQEDAFVAQPEQGKFGPATINSNSIARLISNDKTNDGTIAFVPNANDNEAFFSSGHALDSTFAASIRAYGGIIGGTDIFSIKKNGMVTEIRNLGTAINTISWDGHPTVGARGDSLLLVFASDRYDSSGYSRPYSNAVYDSTQNIRGNSDLFYAFRIGGVWSSVKNLSTVRRDINSSAKEYSPFIFCIEGKTQLFYASNRAGNYDIYQATINVNFAKQELEAENVALVSAPYIQSDSTDFFPFIPYPHVAEAKKNYQFFLASSREDKPVLLGKAQNGNDSVRKNVGAMDIYSIPVELECVIPPPPQPQKDTRTLTYNVVIVDKENPTKSVVKPFLEITRNGKTTKIQDSKFTTTFTSESLIIPPAPYTTKFGNVVIDTEAEAQLRREVLSKPAKVDVQNLSVRGGSTLDTLNCDVKDKMVTSYIFTKYIPIKPIVRSKTISETRDTIASLKKIRVRDTVNFTDTLALGAELDLAKSSIRKNEKVLKVYSDGKSLLVAKQKIVERDTLIAEGKRTITMKRQVADTIPRYDSLTISSLEEASPSVLTRFTELRSFAITKDTTVFDTIFVQPQYYSAPPCSWVFSQFDAKAAEKKSVPFFQTAFWEVNTSSNIKRHREELSQGRLKNASFIELNFMNKYWGWRPGMAEDIKDERTEMRQQRWKEYENYARKVDDYLRAMANRTTKSIIPEFLEAREKNRAVGNKLVMTMLAYSDIREIKRGEYIGTEDIRYMSGHFDRANSQVTLRPIAIKNNSTLVGPDNKTLSELRAWFGYKELMELMMKDSLFSTMVAKGEILLPTENISEQEFRARMERATIIILAEARNTKDNLYVDLTNPTTKAYTGDREDDYYELDDKRRVDIEIDRVEAANGKYYVPRCCGETVQEIKREKLKQTKLDNSPLN